MSTFATDLTLDDLKVEADRLFSRKRLTNFGLPVLVVVYLIYVFFTFDVPGLAARANWDNGRTLVSDSYSYKTHVERDNRNGEVSVAIEGERKGAYPDGMTPEWVTPGETTVIDLEGGHVVRFGPETIEYDIPGYGTVRATPTRAAGVQAELPDGVVPDWINMSKKPSGNHNGCGASDGHPKPVRGVSILHRVGAVLVHPRQPVLRQVLHRTCRSGGIG